MKAAFGLGANLGDRARTLSRGVELLGLRLGRLVRASSVFESEALVLPGDDPLSAPKFLNAAAVFETECMPREMLGIIRDVERELGRRRELERKRWQPRLIDIDLLAIEDIVVNEDGFTVPHPELPRRMFVLEPLAEVWPDWRHPVLGKSIDELIEALQRPGGA